MLGTSGPPTARRPPRAREPLRPLSARLATARSSWASSTSRPTRSATAGLVRTGAAIAHGRALAAEGADLVDVGGESTRPGAERPSVQEELRRVLPVVEALADEDVMVSVDTMRAEVAAQALDAGATLVNDVSGGLADPDMVPLVAERGCPYVAMHWRGHSTQMQSLAVYDDVVLEVCGELADRRDAILAAGVAQERLVLDPGLGFAKHAPHNWALLAAPDALLALGQPVLVGASRKAFLGRIGGADGRTLVRRRPRRRDGRDLGDGGHGGALVRALHDAASTVRALTVVQAALGHAPDEMPRRVPDSWRRRPRPMTDRIVLQGVSARGNHGVLAFEKRDGQTFLVDVTMVSTSRGPGAPTASPPPSTTPRSPATSSPASRARRSTSSSDSPK